MISELLQFEHGERLSHLIYAWDKDAIVSWLDKSQKMNQGLKPERWRVQLMAIIEPYISYVPSDNGIDHTPA